MKQKIKVILIGQEPECRRGLVGALQADPSLELVGRFQTTGQFLHHYRSSAKRIVPDAVISDMKLPGRSGVRAVSEISRQFPDAKMILLSQTESESEIMAAVSVGVDGFLHRSANVDEIIYSIKSACAGGVVVSPAAASYLLHQMRNLTAESGALKILSNREREVLRLLSEGLVKKEIASRLNLSVHTVADHTRKLYSKLDSCNAASAIHKAYQLGLMPV